MSKSGDAEIVTALTQAFTGRVDDRTTQDERPLPPVVLARVLGADVPGQINMQQALNLLGTWVRDLQLTAGSIFAQFRDRGKPTPCAVRVAYNDAVKAYVKYANEVFAEMAKQKVEVEQQLYDRSGMVVETVKIQAPVLPTIIAVADCSGASPALSGFNMSFGIALAPLIVGLKYVLVFAGAIISIQKLEGWFVKAPTAPVDPPEYKSRISDYIECVNRVGSEKRCEPLLTGQMLPAREIPWATIAVVTLISVGAIGGIYIWKRYTGPRRYDRRMLTAVDGAELGGVDDFDGPREREPSGRGAPARFKGCVCF
jgi:hypothetical protein